MKIMIRAFTFHYMLCVFLSSSSLSRDTVDNWICRLPDIFFSDRGQRLLLSGPLWIRKSVCVWVNVCTGEIHWGVWSLGNEGVAFGVCLWLFGVASFFINVLGNPGNVVGLVVFSSFYFISFYFISLSLPVSHFVMIIYHKSHKC